MSSVIELRQELEELRTIPTPETVPFSQLLSSLYQESEHDIFSRLLTTLHKESEELRAMLRPEVRLDVITPDQTEAIDRLTQMFGELVLAIAAKEVTVTVNLPPPVVTVEMPNDPKSEKVFTVKRDKNGLIVSATVKEL